MSDLEELGRKVNAAVNRLAKWRSVFAGWQLGTRPLEDPECQAVRDHREVTMLMRAEINALTSCLIKKGIFTLVEFNEQLLEDVEHLSKQYEKKFPGFKAHDYGMEINTHIAQDTMRGWIR